MDANHLQRYKKILLVRRDALSAAWDEATVVPRAGELDGDVMDCARADAEANLQVLLRQSDDRLLKAIDSALARIQAGSFGICEACEQPISKVRLDAVPWTPLCRECQEREESAA